VFYALKGVVSVFYFVPLTLWVQLSRCGRCLRDWVLGSCQQLTLSIFRPFTHQRHLTADTLPSRILGLDIHARAPVRSSPQHKFPFSPNRHLLLRVCAHYDQRPIARPLFLSCFSFHRSTTTKLNVYASYDNTGFLLRAIRH
ncbi:hypothetical protein BC827DRAFT_1244301, partial [Russula dissimulans]